ncbi:DUF624 domain-containing protein [Tuanshanicoccus lijuaniae]|uniref:DUF624 domain-containing protein n=1 Tax=Aerococcaceae bacterium zg-1292 TaxID=2774330 RepID=UPI001937CEA4|nr:DUF624 domain-containing protein [Aerococcaceae bacterium zg-1292]QQA36860.1 DUF624 domain-containing protein [Aerococcaceae bacterium zg-1292]
MSNKLMWYLRIITNGVVLSILFWVGLLSGVFILGLIPSTKALIKTYHLLNDSFNYSEIIKCFVKTYILEFKKNWLESLIISVVLLFMIAEYHLVDEFPIISAFFKLPLRLLIIYMVSMLANYIIMQTFIDERKKNLLIKALLAPFITIKESLVIVFCFVCISSLAEINLMLLLLSASFFVVVIEKIIVRKLIKKGIINEKKTII